MKARRRTSRSLGSARWMLLFGVPAPDGLHLTEAHLEAAWRELRAELLEEWTAALGKRPHLRPWGFWYFDCGFKRMSPEPPPEEQLRILEARGEATEADREAAERLKRTRRVR